MLFRPSLPWRFPIREVLCEQKESQEQQQQQEEAGWKSSFSSSSRKKVAKSILFYGFQKLHQGLFGRISDAFPSFAAMVCSHPQEDSPSVGFRSYIRELLGAFLMLFRPPLPWCFPIREVPSEQKESQEQEQQQQQEETGGKSIGSAAAAAGGNGKKK